jgi:hypothetical protein
MNALPKKIIRLDDGMEFILNEETQLYRVHLGIPHLDDPKYLHIEYGYDLLMTDPRNRGLFKVSDETENIQAMKKAWFESVRI